MRRISSFLAIAIVVLALGCKKSPELATDNIPVFSGNIETNVSFKKVIFSASFTNLDPANAEDCGFEWSQKSNTTNKTVGIGSISEDKFSVQLVVKLEEGVQYQVRAWIKVGSKKFYSQPSYFYGTVALRPEIISLNRTYALWGDTIRIKVRNLLPDILPTDITVRIDNSNAFCVFADSTEIAVIMPYSFTNGKLNVNLLVNNQSAANTAEIENALPEITTISKNLVYFDDTITIRGKFWPEYSNRVFPVYDNWFKVKYKIVSYTNNNVVIRIPDEGACIPRLDLYFAITSPQGVMGQNLIYSSLQITRTGFWKLLNPALPTNRVKSASLNGEAYFLDQSGNYYANSPFYKYDPKTDSWTELPNNPFPSSNYQSLVACKGELYVGFLRNAVQTTNFMKYNIQSNTWIPCANLPACCAWDMITVSMQNKIYVFIQGSKFKWVYDPSLNSWTESYCDMPDLMMDTKTIIYNGEYYFYKGASGDVIYKYDLSSGTFSPVNIIGMNSTNELFEINDKYYCMAGCKVYEVNLSNRTLIPINRFSNYLYYDYFQNENNTFLLGIGNTAYFLAAGRNVVTFTPDTKK
ncbi:MAG: hypothetical protein Q7U54_07095 [Bacteroidales bacterium]|nr:hypothetical protein [Bacteroidales bacterium]